MKKYINVKNSIVFIVIVTILVLIAFISIYIKNENLKKEKFLNVVKKLQYELDEYKYTKFNNNLKDINIYANPNIVLHNLEVQNKETIYNILPSLASEDLSIYKDKFQIINNNITYIGTERKKKQLCKKQKIPINNNLPNVELTTNNVVFVNFKEVVTYTLVIKSDSSLKLNLDNNISIIDVATNSIIKDSKIKINNKLVENDYFKIIELEVQTSNLGQGTYSLQIEANSVENESGTISNSIVSLTNFEVLLEKNLNPIFKQIDSLEKFFNKNIKIDIEYSNECVKKLYSYDTNEWVDYEQSLTIENNKKVYARCEDAKSNIYNTLLEITNIDKSHPQNAVVNLKLNKNKIFGDITYVDNESGIDIEASRYVINTNSDNYNVESEVWNSASKINNVKMNITEELQPNTYYVHMLSVDKAGNKRSNISQKIEIVN